MNLQRTPLLSLCVALRWLPLYHWNLSRALVHIRTTDLGKDRIRYYTAYIYSRGMSHFLQ